MDKVFLRGLKIATIIGILPWERMTRQTVVVDLEIATDISRAAQQDLLHDTIDYDAVAKRLTEFITNSQYNLLETLAENIVALLRNEFHLSWLWLRLSKPGAVANCENVGVIVERTF
ncbi:MAG: dihydroneopterin aldolase [Gammaproteobacteria bacterium]